MQNLKQLADFLEVLNGYTPTVPEKLVEHYLHQIGFTSDDPRIIRMIALAAHKFLLDVMHDTMQYQRLRTENDTALKSSSAESSTAVLTTEDLIARYILQNVYRNASVY
uniref:Transcription initiation factor TFIID subunit putati n=1 Tax=Albugo laibachii Nc14 TaxID=890382 RepID=F0WM17_9STRA|nr:transcription initiation factor TFIID subunit putati [Albugo laibachii Nc14]|eukprot:CCA22344.1 transcription initiation factor TFIID subunit putati [Albugo laibachii Nc14]